MAASLVKDKDVVVIDDGTTTLQMIDSLVLKKQLTVLVTSVYTLNMLIGYKNRNIFDGEIILIGCRINSKHYRTSGTLAVEFMSNFNVEGYTKNPIEQLIKYDLQDAAKKRDTVLNEWSTRYDSKSEPKS